ncbi:MAG: hypothetical protein HUU20_24865 [Pirellulales bacterium]|nr:hypothetical protein [Pirellulales bacterium]
MTHRVGRFCRPIVWAASLGFLAALCCDGLGAEPRKQIVNTFDQGRESWQIYDYNGGIAGGGNVFFLPTWEKTGGVNDSGCIWADDSRWRIDTPENPHSILAFILYHHWITLDEKEPGRTTPRPTTYVPEGRLDMRNAEISVRLRGDGLDLKGAKCYFWVMGGPGRWHYTARPLKISEGAWGPEECFVLPNDESQWHFSWPPGGGNLNEALKTSHSCGFSFVGFSDEVTGKFSMDEFRVRLRPAGAEP